MTREEAINNLKKVLGFSPTYDKAFYTLFPNGAEPSLPSDVDEAAEEYTQRMLESWQFDSTGLRPLREPFKAGAEWQASRMPMPEDTVLFNKGVQEGRRLEREDMTRDAVEGEVITNGFYPYEPRIVASYPNCPYALGDKVRIVVLKAEEE